MKCCPASQEVMGATSLEPWYYLQPIPVLQHHLQPTPVHWHSLQPTSLLGTTYGPQWYCSSTYSPHRYPAPSTLHTSTLAPTYSPHQYPGTTDSPYWYLALPTGNCGFGWGRWGCAQCPRWRTWTHGEEQVPELRAHFTAISYTSWCGTQTMDLVAMALCSGHSPFLRLCEKVSLYSWVGNRGFLGVYWGSIMFSDWHLGRLLMARALRGDQVTLCPS